MNKKNEKIFLTLLIVLILVEPILDLMWFNNGIIPEIFGFTLPTLVRMGLIAVLGVLSFRVIEFNKKYLFLLVYVTLIIIYFAGHQYNCMNFQSLVPGNFNYSMWAEMLYVVRMCIPIAVIYFTYNCKISETIFEKCIVAVSVFMSASVVITNILKIAYGSYTSKRIEGNIFDWFLNGDHFVSNQLASKGFFYSSITSTVMVLLYPYLLNIYMKKRKARYLVIALLQGIALIMFGTKATSFSAIIVSVLMFLMYLFIGIVKRDFKINKYVCMGVLVIIACNMLLFKVSPSYSKMQFDNEYSKEIDEEKDAKEYQLSEDNKEEIIEFFAENYHYVSIKEDFLTDSYPYKYDPLFWYEFCDKNVPSQRMQNRIVEEEMLKRVKEINANQEDDWFGIGYSRTSNIYNLEKDFIYQFYSMGSLGVLLLLGPYILIILLIMGLMLWKYKRRFTLFNCSLILGLGLVCCLSYYSGNVMENLGITIVMGFVMGYLLKCNFGKVILEETNAE